MIDGHWEIVIEANRAIEVGEEILVNYGDDYQQNDGSAVVCRCDRPFKQCSGFVSSNVMRKFKCLPKHVKGAPWLCSTCGPDGSKRGKGDRDTNRELSEAKKTIADLENKLASANDDMQKLASGDSIIANLEEEILQLKQVNANLRNENDRIKKGAKRWDKVTTYLKTWSASTGDTGFLDKDLSELTEEEKEMGFLFFLNQLQSGKEFKCPNCGNNKLRNNIRRHFARCNANAMFYCIALHGEGYVPDKEVRDILKNKV